LTLFTSGPVPGTSLLIMVATSFGFTLPAWVGDEIADAPEVLPTLEDRMALVHRLAGRNFGEGNGGPFAAVVVERDSGRLVSVGVNVVLASGISSGHAEVVALGLAQTAVGGWDLGGEGLPAHELVVNWRPCVQCYGATLWSGVRSLVVAGDGPELEQLTGFDEGPMVLDWVDQFRARGIDVTRDVLRDDAVATWRAYAEHVAATGAVVYNARSSNVP
jgi:tRNA(Arg) A34 adenosine deaminase TadA